MSANLSSSTPSANSRFFFRQPEESDLPYIARWMAANTRLPEERRERIVRKLQKQFHDPKNNTLAFSWIAIAGKKRVFFLELAGKEELFLITPIDLAMRPRLALSIWKKALDHILSLGPVDTLWVTLEDDQLTEDRALRRLGFTSSAAGEQCVLYEYHPRPLSSL